MPRRTGGCWRCTSRCSSRIDVKRPQKTKWLCQCRVSEYCVWDGYRATGIETNSDKPMQHALATNQLYYSSPASTTFADATESLLSPAAESGMRFSLSATAGPRNTLRP